MRARWRDVVAVLALGATACSPFGTEAGTLSDVDGGATGTPDAQVTGTGCGIPSPSTETFEASFSPPWSTTGAGLTLHPTGGRTGGMGELTLPDSPSFLSVEVSASCTIDAVGYIQIATLGDGEADFFVLADTSDGTGSVVGFTHNNAARSFAFEDPAHGITTVATTMPPGWTRVELHVTPSAHTYTMSATSADGATVATTNGSITTGWPRGNSIWVKIGAAYVANITQPWKVDFDDVTVTATP